MNGPPQGVLVLGSAKGQERTLSRARAIGRATQLPAFQPIAPLLQNAVSTKGQKPPLPGVLTFHKYSFWLDQVSPVGTMAAVSIIKITLFSGARVQCNTPFGTVKP